MVFHDLSTDFRIVFPLHLPDAGSLLVFVGHNDSNGSLPVYEDLRQLVNSGTLAGADLSSLVAKVTPLLQAYSLAQSNNTRNDLVTLAADNSLTIAKSIARPWVTTPWDDGWV